MTRVAFVLPDLSGGGAERVALSLIGDFLADGCEVDLVLAQEGGQLGTLVPSGASIERLRVAKLRAAFWPLVAYLRRRRPDAVQVSMWPLTAIAALAVRLSGVEARLVVSDHGILSKQYGGSTGAWTMLRATTRTLYPLASARVCVSEECADDLAQASGLPRHAIEVVPNPVALPPRPPRTNARVENLWPAGARILSVGNLIVVKNHRVLVEAIALVNRSRPASLMVLGRGDLRAPIEQRAAELGIAGRVILPGYALDPWPYYASADLFALSSDHESYGNALVEALAAGLPIVSTDCGGGPREILGDGQYGSLVPVGDAEALAGGILARLESPADAAGQRKRAQELGGHTSYRRYRQLMLG